MHHRLGTFSIAATTLLLSLSSLSLAGCMGVLSAQAQIQNQEGERQTEPHVTEKTAEVEALLQQGFQQLYTSQLQEALKSFQQVLAQSREIGDRAQEAAALLGVAETTIWLGRYNEALELAQQGLAIYQEINDSSGEAKALHLVSDAYLDLNQIDSALETLGQALAIQQEVGDRQGEGRIVGWLGIAQVKQGKVAEGLERLQQAIAILQEPVSTPLEQLQQQYYQGIILTWIGNAHRQLEEFEKASEVLQQALTVSRAISNRSVQKITLDIMGLLYENQNQPTAALDAYQQALALAQQTEHPIAEAWLLYRIGQFHIQQEQHQQGLDVYQQALTLFQEEKNAEGEGETWFAIAGAYESLKQYPDAVKAYQQSLSIFQSLNQPRSIGNILNRIGKSYQQQEQYPQALAAYQQALEVFQSLEDRSAEMTALSGIWFTSLQQGQYLQAREAAEQQLKIARQLSDRYQETNALLSLGQSYTAQAQQLSQNASYLEAIALSQQALEPLQQASTLAKAANRPEITRIVVIELVHAYARQGGSLQKQQQYAEAVVAIQQALTILRENRQWLAEPEFFQFEMLRLFEIANAYNYDEQYVNAIRFYQEALPIAEQLNDLYWQSSFLFNISVSYSRLSDHPKALQIAQQHLVLVQEKLNDPAEEIDALVRVGQVYGSMGQYADELEHYQQALVIAREIKDVQNEATLLGNIGTVYSNRGSYLQALEYQQQVLALQQDRVQQLQTADESTLQKICEYFNTSGEYGKQACLEAARHHEAVTLNNIAVTYDGLGRYPEAIAAYQQALNIIREQDNRTVETSTLQNLGIIYIYIGEYPKALELCQQALQIAETIGDLSQQAIALNSIARVYDEQGQYPKALKLYQRSLALARKIGEPKIEATVLNNIGSIYRSQGNFAEALTTHQQALAIGQQIGASIGKDLNNIGTVYAYQGRYAEARESYQQVLEIAQTTGDRNLEATTRGSLAQLYAEQAEYSQALDAQQQVLELWREIGDRGGEIGSLLGMGYLNRVIGQYDKALEWYQQALTLSREIGQRWGEVAAIDGFAGVYRKREDYSQALEFYQQALNQVREMEDVAGESNLLRAMGIVYERQGQSAQAIELLERALPIQQEIGIRPDEARTLNGLGVAYASQGKLAEALEALQQALLIARDINDPATEAQVLADLGKVLAGENQPELAIVFLKQSVNITETIRKELRTLPTEQQQSYTETVAATYRQLADLLLQQDRVLEAQRVLDLLKVQELEDYLSNVRGDENMAEGVAERPPEQQIWQSTEAQIDQAIALGKELIQLENIPPTQRSEAQQQRAIALRKTQQEQIQAFQDFLKSPEVAQLVAQLRQTTQGGTFDLEEYAKALQDNLKRLQQDAAILYPLVLDDRLELVLVTPYSPPIRRTATVGREELNRVIAEFRSALQTPTSDATVPAQKLYNWLIKPLENDLAQAKTQTLIYAPDGQLRYIPLAALHDGNQWLVQRFQINNITALSLTELETQPAKNLQVFAGAFTQGYYSFEINGQPFSFSGLPSAGREVKVLAQTVPNTTTVLDQQFNADTVFLMNDYSVVHLATHAAFVVGQPEESFILFGNGDRATLRDVQTWSLPDVDLVVLSACETGLGDKLGDGREILGFGYLMQKTGAKAAIASLWQVDDGGTQTLMNAFYELLNGNTISKAAALRQAQLTLIQRQTTASTNQRATIVVESTRDTLTPEVANRLNHPYYWAPFILIGNGL